jgi:hypothetical protein
VVTADLADEHDAIVREHHAVADRLGGGAEIEQRLGGGLVAEVHATDTAGGGQACDGEVLGRRLALVAADQDRSTIELVGDRARQRGLVGRARVEDGDQARAGIEGGIRFAGGGEPHRREPRPADPADPFTGRDDLAAEDVERVERATVVVAEHDARVPRADAERVVERARLARDLGIGDRGGLRIDIRGRRGEVEVDGVADHERRQRPDDELRGGGVGGNHQVGDLEAGGRRDADDRDLAREVTRARDREIDRRLAVERNRDAGG